MLQISKGGKKKKKTQTQPYFLILQRPGSSKAAVGGVDWPFEPYSKGMRVRETTREASRLPSYLTRKPPHRRPHQREQQAGWGGGALPGREAAWPGSISPWRVSSGPLNQGLWINTISEPKRTSVIILSQLLLCTKEETEAERARDVPDRGVRLCKPRRPGSA